MKRRIDTYTPDLLWAQDVKRNQEYVKTYEKKGVLVEAATRFLEERWESLLQLMTKFEYSEELLWSYW